VTGGIRPPEVSMTFLQGFYISIPFFRQPIMQQAVYYCNCQRPEWMSNIVKVVAKEAADNSTTQMTELIQPYLPSLRRARTPSSIPPSEMPAYSWTPMDADDSGGLGGDEGDTGQILR